MSRYFTINGKKYLAKPFDFNMVCELESYGVPITQMTDKPMSMVRAYFALCFNGSKEDAGKEIEAHVISGGNFNDIYEVMGAEMNESDFFQALNKNQDEETQEMENKEGQKSESDKAVKTK